MKKSKLIEAIERRDVHAVRRLLASGLSPTARRFDLIMRPKEPTPLLAAVRAGSAEIVESLLDAGADVNQDTRWWYTPLTLACNIGDINMARLLLDKGADANKARRNHATPLMKAAFYGREPLVDLLLEKGADPRRVLDGSDVSVFRISEKILRKLDGAAGRTGEERERGV
jgi:ankyrin repeat protein